MKQRHEASASSSMPSSSFVLPVFTNKVVARGRCLDLDFLEREGFIIGQKLRMLGLEPCCSLNLLTYPNLFKEFLSLAVHYESGYKATLRGIEVKLTPTTVSTFLNIFLYGNVAFTTDS